MSAEGVLEIVFDSANQSLQEAQEYFSLDKFEDYIVINGPPIYNNIFDINKADQSTDYVAVPDAPHLTDNSISTSLEAPLDVAKPNDPSLIDHNYFNNGEAEVTLELGFLIQRNAVQKCEDCEKLFENEASLQCHMKNHIKKHIKCEICDKCFSQQSNLWKHIRIHTGEQPFECPVCKRKFSQRANMQKHLMIHAGEKPYECAHCSRCFTQLANLNKHMRVHVGAKPYKCRYDEKTFSQQSNLFKHHHVHEEVRPYTCSHCLAAFTQRSTLDKHVAMHTKVRPFMCETCGKTYVQKINLLKHQMRCIFNLHQVETRYVTEPDEYITISGLEGLEENTAAEEENYIIFEVDETQPDMEKGYFLLRDKSSHYTKIG